ncbi:unnamed protein product [Sphenostylis stenocarpa]|uniref:Uncharacterized protein n=1 Tax=Sphenostylis stenocarpa TaxID=92480 RepID=A0AA86V9W8_9FABA|nr:unnamed protein product [Sphenostylis stenocarpa]
MIATHVSVPRSRADQPKRRKREKERTVKFNVVPVLAGKVLSPRFFYLNTRRGSSPPFSSTQHFFIVGCGSASASPIRIGNSVSHSLSISFSIQLPLLPSSPLFLDLSQSRKLLHSNPRHRTIPLTTLTLMLTYPSILS